MGHSKSYDLQPPKGPAGENLAWASWSLSAEEATMMWYDEIKDCGPFPGCSQGKKGTVGHFTALIWDNAKEIGCHANKHGLRACQYKGADEFDCTTPNNMRFYEQNVFGPVFSRAECEEKLKQCNSGESWPDPDPQEHEEPDQPAENDEREDRPDPRRRSPPDPRRRSPQDSGDDTSGCECTGSSWVCEGKSQSSCEMRSSSGCAWTCADDDSDHTSAVVERAEKAAERAEAAAEKAAEAAENAAASAEAASNNVAASNKGK